MTDPVIARLTFTAVIGHEPSPEESATVISHYLLRLPEEVASSSGYKVLAGVDDLLPRLSEAGFLLGLTTGTVEAAAHIKLERGNLNRFFSFGGYGSDAADRGELTRKAIERAGEILGTAVDPHTRARPRRYTEGHLRGPRCRGDRRRRRKRPLQQGRAE